jgi:RNase P/RNase MRP subunit POP5
MKQKGEKKKRLKMLPSLKEKRHYLVIKPGNKEKIDKLLLDFLGVLGYARAGPQFIESRKEYVILSVVRKYVKEVKSALVQSDFKCVGVSGTIKKSRRFI